MNHRIENISAMETFGSRGTPTAEAEVRNGDSKRCAGIGNSTVYAGNGTFRCSPNK